MANASEKFEDNLLGPIYVDKECIDCFACQGIAPDNFKRNDEGGYSFVYKQPEDDDEYQLCLDAIKGCPVDAIGEDGDGN